MPRATRRTLIAECYVCKKKLYADQDTIYTGIVKEVPWHHEYFCPECWVANPDVQPEPTDWDSYCESKGLLCRRDHHHVVACYNPRQQAPSPLEHFRQEVAHEREVEPPSKGDKEHSKRVRQGRTQKKDSAAVLTEPMTEYQRQFHALVEKIRAMNPADQLNAMSQWSSLHTSIKMVRQALVECDALSAEVAEPVVIRVDENNQLCIHAYCIDEDAAKRFIAHLEPMEASGLVRVSKTIREESIN